MRRSRHGLTLIEILVSMAILMVMVMVAVPSMQGLMDVQQRAAAKELAQTYTWLVDEAKLRNVSFRVVYNLDRNTWKVEAGDPNTLVYSSPEEREKAEEEEKDKLSRYTKRELEEGHGDAVDLRDQDSKFQGLDDPAFDIGGALEGDAVFAYVYTPQYGEDGKRASKDPPEDEADESIAYTYIFPDGTAEHTVVRIVDQDDPEDGWTVTVEPLTGKVQLTPDVVDPTDSLSWLPEEGPQLR